MSRDIIATELLARGLVSRADWDLAKARAAEQGRPLLKVLVDGRMSSEDDVYRIVAEAAGMPYAEMDQLSPDPTAIGKLNGDWARKFNALPFGWNGSVLQVAIADPTSLTLKDDLIRLTGSVPELHLCAPGTLTDKIQRTYRSDTEMDQLGETITTESLIDIMSEQSMEGAGESDAPIVKYVNLLISQAVADRASDIHIEPGENDLQVRYRIDGVLHKQMSSSRSVLNGVVSRIKVMSNLDIAERRIPQDGRMTVNVQGRKIDLRVATLPTVYGEKVVMRILDNSSAPTDFGAIGFSDYHIQRYATQYTKANGMLLVTGPTGSGKSTTLYATLNAVVSPTINVITVEDPVEYRMRGISQMQINTKAGLTFSAALRSILRADPDVVLVGEIRDRETAQIAIEAALTGHLVLSSLHTNDAPSAVTRLIEMGIEPFLVGSALSTVVAQRLLRRLCERCKQEYRLPRHDAELLGIPVPDGEDGVTVFRPLGCVTCSKTGYRGRSAIHELLICDERIERMANEGAHSDQIRAEATQHGGMKSMRDDGWEKVLAGITSVEEVLRVVG